MLFKSFIESELPPVFPEFKRLSANFCTWHYPTIFAHGIEFEHGHPTDRGWTDMRLPELAAIGKVLALQSGVHLDREARRTRPVFYKWMDGYWDKFGPNVGFIRRIYDKNLDDPRR
jgi:hypothetical protein